MEAQRSIGQIKLSETKRIVALEEETWRTSGPLNRAKKKKQLRIRGLP
jgi:hypothetical protein